MPQHASPFGQSPSLPLPNLAHAGTFNPQYHFPQPDPVHAARHLEEVLANLPAGPARAAAQTEVNYFREHEARMDYRAARRRGEPIGSGAIEATCRQYQCRFKQPGQLWSEKGDAPLLGNLLAQRPRAPALPSRCSF